MHEDIALYPCLKQYRFISRKQFIWMSVGLAFISAFCGQNGVVDNFISLLWLAAIAALINYDDIFSLILPITLFQNIITLPFGLTVFNVLVIILFFKIIWKRTVSWRISEYLFFLILTAYGLVYLRKYLGGMVSTALYVLSIAVMCECWKIFRNSESFERTMFLFLCCGFAAGMYGFFNENSRLVVQNGVLLNRFCGTSSDPNIMGCKWVICMIPLVFGSFIKNRITVATLFLILVFFISLTGSTTAMIALVIILIIYVISKKVTKTVLILSMIGGVLVITVILRFDNILVLLANTRLLGSQAKRLIAQLAALKIGDFTTATSLRSDVWQGYMNYFFNAQGLFRKLFGGNVANVYGIEKNFAQAPWIAAAHNTNIDVLMSIGFVGLALILFMYIRQVKEHIKHYSDSHDSVSLMKLMINIIMLVYTFSISFFPSFTLMLLWLI